MNSLREFIIKELKAKNVEDYNSLSDDEIKTIMAVNSIFVAYNKCTYFAYLWIKESKQKGFRYIDRYNSLALDTDDKRNMFGKLRTSYGIKVEFKETDGKTVFDNNLSRMLEYKYIYAISESQVFKQRQLMDYLGMAIPRTPYKSIEELFDNAGINSESIARYNVIWDRVIIGNLLKAVSLFGHKISILEEGTRYYIDQSISYDMQLSIKRLQLIYRAIHEMLPSNPKKYISKMKMIGKVELGGIDSVMFLHTLEPIFWIVCKYPRLAFNINIKALKLLLDIAWNKGTDSTEFLDRVSRLAAKTDREIILKRRKEYAYITKHLMSDDKILELNSYDLSEINDRLKRGEYLGHLSTYVNK